MLSCGNACDLLICFNVLSAFRRIHSGGGIENTEKVVMETLCTPSLLKVSILFGKIPEARCGRHCIYPCTPEHHWDKMRRGQDWFLWKQVISSLRSSLTATLCAFPTLLKCVFVGWGGSKREKREREYLTSSLSYVTKFFIQIV